MTFKIDFDFTTHGANSASDASINYQETAALLTDIVPGDANDTNFTIIFNSNTTIGDFDPIYGESMPADFGNDTFGHISSFKPSKIVTLQPGERRYYRLIGTSREGSNQAITRALHIISGGYAVRRIK